MKPDDILFKIRRVLDWKGEKGKGYIYSEI